MKVRRALFQYGNKESNKENTVTENESVKDADKNSDSEELSSSGSREKKSDANPHGVITVGSTRFALVHHVTLDELESFINDTGVSLEQVKGVWVFDQEESLRKEKVGKLVLSEGTFSKVRIARQINDDGSMGQFFVVRKLLSNSVITRKTQGRYNREQAYQWVKKELALLKSIKGTQVVSAPIISVELKNSQNEKQLYQFIEIAEFGDLTHAIKSIFPTPFFQEVNRNSVEGLEPKKMLILNYFTYQMIAGLSSIHASDVVHRDIKPENILVNADFKIKFTDFSSAIDYRGKRPAEAPPPADAAYFCPLYLYDKNHLKEMTSEQKGKIGDMWALGLTILELYHGKNYPQSCKVFVSLAFDRVNKKYENLTVEEKAATIKKLNQDIELLLEGDNVIPQHVKEVIMQLMEMGDPRKQINLLDRVLHRYKKEFNFEEINASIINAVKRESLTRLQKENHSTIEMLRKYHGEAVMTKSGSDENFEPEYVDSLLVSQFFKLSPSRDKSGVRTSLSPLKSKS